MSDKQIELAYWLTSDDPNAAHWRKTAPTAEWAAALREYKGLNMEHTEVEPQLFFWAVNVLSEGRNCNGRDIAELSSGELDRYIATRSTEADRLIASLDDELLSPDEHQQTLAGLDEITGELKRAHHVKKKLERRGVS